MELSRGSFVTHSKQPGWGVGQVVAVEGSRVFVYFQNHPNSNGRAVKLGSAALLQELDSAGAAEFFFSAFPRLEKVGVDYILPSAGGLTQLEAEEKFWRLFPEAFGGGGQYFERERGYKSKASALWQRLLGDGQLEALIASSNVAELSTRFLQVEAASLNLLHKFERLPFREAVERKSQAVLDFSAALAAFISAPEGEAEAAFTRLVVATSELQRDGQRLLKWPVVTLFPFLADPTRHMFVKPEVTKEAADRLRFDLKYESSPNWKTYAAVLELTQMLRQRLPQVRDLIDVQSFIWSVSKYSTSAEESSSEAVDAPVEGTSSQEPPDVSVPPDALLQVEDEPRAPNPSPLPSITDVAPVLRTLDEVMANTRVADAPALTGGASTPSASRWSNDAKFIGDRAEEIYFEELSRRSVAGLRWVSKEGETPGWDIEYVGAEGTLVACEVKGTVGRAFSSFDLTANEWKAAERRGQHFVLVLIADCHSATPSITEIWNPAEVLPQHGFVMEPIAFRFRPGKLSSGLGDAPVQPGGLHPDHKEADPAQRTRHKVTSGSVLR